MPRLEHRQILALHAAVLSAPLVDSRDALLAGVDAGFIGRLPKAATPSDQILRDLTTMNDAGALANGSVPLVIWLQNASALAKSLREGALFERTLQLWPEFNVNASPAALPTPPPPALAPKVSLRSQHGGEASTTGATTSKPATAAKKEAAEPGSAVPWTTYFGWTVPLALLLGGIGAGTSATSAFVTFLSHTEGARVLLFATSALALALAGTWAVERSGQRPIASSLAAAGAGAIAWLFIIEIGSLAALGFIRSNRDYVDYEGIRGEALRSLVESHVGWPVGVVIGAGILLGFQRLRRAPRADDRDQRRENTSS